MATTINKDTKDITFAGSPQFIAATDVAAITIAANFFVLLKIWVGDKTAIPATDQESLFLPAIPTGQELETSISFEISKYLVNYIDDGTYVDSDGINYNGDSAVWYRYTISADTGSLPITSDVKLATNGVGRIVDGTNPGTTVVLENNKIFGNHSTKSILDPSGKYVVPVYIGDNSSNNGISTDTQGISISGLGFTLNSIDSREQVAYVPLSSSTFGSEWVDDGQIKYTIDNSNGNTPLRGLSFNKAEGDYLDLGIVPLLNSQDSYVKLKFQMFGLVDEQRPFGYAVSGSNQFNYFQLAGDDRWRLQNANITVTPSVYPNPSFYQEMDITVEDFPAKELQVAIDGLPILTEGTYADRLESSIQFYIGALNLNGVAGNFTSLVFTDAEFFNGTTTKVFNFGNNWNGAINHGGTPVVAYNGGDDMPTWLSVDNQYTIDINCSKGEPMALKYINFSGVLDTFPINGIGKEAITVKKTQYNNAILESDLSFNPLSHVKKTFISNGTQRFDLGTGWIDESSNEMVDELLLSKLVWLETKDQVYPIQIKTNSIQKINRVWNNKLDYSFRVDVANQIINNLT